MQEPPSIKNPAAYVNSDKWANEKMHHAQIMSRFFSHTELRIRVLPAFSLDGNTTQEQEGSSYGTIDKSPPCFCKFDRDSAGPVGSWLPSSSGLTVVKRLCSTYPNDQDKAPPHHDSGGTPCVSASVGTEALAVKELEESAKPRFVDQAHCSSKITGFNIGCLRRSEQGTVHMAQLLVSAVSWTIGALL